MFVVVVIQTPAYARLIRTATLSTKSSEYVLAIRSLGTSPGRILLVHILPNIVGPLFIIASMDIPSVIALEAGLTYLGLGIPPPAPSWGRILQEGFESIRDAPWIVVAGGIPLILTTLGFTFLGESLRDLARSQAAPDRLSMAALPAAKLQPTPNVLEVRNLSIRFRTPRGPVLALRNVNVDVPRGSVVGLVGESGSGKSTLALAVMRLMAGNATITGGSLDFAGRGPPAG